jgi:hypothetical protein
MCLNFAETRRDARTPCDGGYPRSRRHVTDGHALLADWLHCRFLSGFGSSVHDRLPAAIDRLDEDRRRGSPGTDLARLRDVFAVAFQSVDRAPVVWRGDLMHVRPVRALASLPPATRAVVRPRTRGTARSRRTPPARRYRRCCSRTAPGSAQPESCTSPTPGPRGGRRCRPRE